MKRLCKNKAATTKYWFEKMFVLRSQINTKDVSGIRSLLSNCSCKPLVQKHLHCPLHSLNHFVALVPSLLDHFLYGLPPQNTPSLASPLLQCLLTQLPCNLLIIYSFVCLLDFVFPQSQGLLAQIAGDPELVSEF